METKKPYTPPTITDHGKVTTKTQGMISTAYETYGRYRRVVGCTVAAVAMVMLMKLRSTGGS